MNPEFEIEFKGLVKYHGRGGKVIVPEGIIEISESAFENCKTVEEIILPESLALIGSRAFSGCTALRKVTLPRDMLFMNDRAFSGCTALTEITIPKGILFIKEKSFSGCTSLKQIILPEGLEDIDSSVFCNCTELTDATLPSTIQRLGFDIFQNCPKLKLHFMQYTFSTDLTKSGLGWADALLHMIKYRNFSCDIPLPVKARFLFEAYFSNSEDEKLCSYIQENFIKLFNALTDIQIVREIIESGEFIPEDNRLPRKLINP